MKRLVPALLAVVLGLVLAAGATAAPPGLATGSGGARAADAAPAAATGGVTTLAWSMPLAPAARDSVVLKMSNVPEGSYLATLSAGFLATEAAVVSCEVYNSAERLLLTDSSIIDVSGITAISATRKIHLPRHDTLYVVCQASVKEEWATRKGQPLQVSLTRIDRVVERSFKEVKAT